MTPGTHPVYFSFLFCLIDNVSRIFTIAQRCRVLRRPEICWKGLNFLSWGKKNMVSGFFFPSPLFSSNRFSIFDTFVFHLLPNQIFSTFFQLFVIFDCLAKKRSFFFSIHYLRFGYVHFSPSCRMLFPSLFACQLYCFSLFCFIYWREGRELGR